MKRPKGRHSPADHFPELDQLVLREIQALVENTEREVPAVEPGPEAKQHRHTRPDREMPKQEQQKMRPRRPEPEPDPINWDKAEDPNSSGNESEMLTVEEQRFIDDTVQWLRSRDNRDIVMANIWSRVIDSDPDAFYSPEDETAEASRAEESPSPSEQGPHSGVGSEG